MLTKNQRADVRIESCTPEGFGICRLEGRAVFVASAMAGERWEILILKVTASAVWAKGLRLLEPSSCRCEPDCRNLCGGCTLRHMDYEEELRVKKEYVDDCLCRLGKQPTGTAAVHPNRCGPSEPADSALPEQSDLCRRYRGGKTGLRILPPPNPYLGSGPGLPAAERKMPAGCPGGDGVHGTIRNPAL